MRRLFQPRIGSRRRLALNHDRLPFDALEARCLLAATIVNTTNDSGAGSLRQAIEDVNSGLYDEIDFNLSGSYVIQPATALPTITNKVTIDGTSQSGYVGTPLVMLSGATSGGDGLVFATSASASSVVKGLSIGNYSGAGIRVLTTTNTVTIAGNYIGLDLAGTPAPNGTGVSIDGSASNIIGGLVAASRNIISGNTGSGIAISGTDAKLNTVEGNYIGTDSTGNSAIANGTGITISGTGTATTGASNNIIGGLVDAARNVISGNTVAGIVLTDSGTTGNSITHNYIGTNSAGSTALGNGIGVQILASASANSVGTSAATGGNVISGNTQFDVLIDGATNNTVAKNTIGLQQDGQTALVGAPTGSIGVGIQNAATGNLIGGVNAGNVISGHLGSGAAGVQIRGLTGPSGTAASQNTLQANKIGVAADGLTLRPNEVGLILADGAANNVIGGLNSGNGNTISGNTTDGIRLSGSTTTTNTIQGNNIGVASNGTTGAANGGNGILISGAFQTMIGGTAAGAGNVIANSTGYGVKITSGTGNAILRNSIYSNALGGILLDPSGTNPNNLQVAPIITAVHSNATSTVATGTIQAAANSTYTIDIYSDPSATTADAGQGRTYLGSATATTDGTGLGTWTATSTTQVPVGQIVSALATSSSNDTSQFANNVAATTVTTNVSIAMTASAVPPTVPGEVGTGNFIVYTITVTNTGPDTATGVVVTDTLPSGAVTFVGATTGAGTISQSSNVVTLTVGTLAPNETRTFTLTGTVATSIPATNPVQNSATVAVGAGITNTSATTTASVSTTVVASVNLQVTKVASPTPPTKGSDFTYVITVTNTSAVRADNVVLTDALPAGLTYVSATTTQGTVSESGGVVTAAIGSLPPSGATLTAGYTATIYITVHPTTDGPFTNTAIATASQPQLIAGDNVSVSTVTPVTPAVLPDVAAVEVVSVSRVGVHRVKGRIVIAFSQPLDAFNAELLKNYTVIAAQRNGTFKATGPFVRLRSARYDAAHNTVTLTPVHAYSFFQRVRLTIVGEASQGVRGTNGLFLAGTNGVPGTNYHVAFKGFGPASAAAARARAARARS